MLLTEAIDYLKTKGVIVRHNYLRHLCVENKLKHSKLYRFYTVDKKELDTFAKKFDGVHIGRPKKEK